MVQAVSSMPRLDPFHLALLLTLRFLLSLCMFIGSTCFSVASTHSPSTPAPASHPNVLLIVSDDQAWTDFGFMGHPTVRTPNLDRLASKSLRFPRGYVPSSLCCPSLASLITGKYPHQHGVVCNDPPRPPGLSSVQYYASQEYRDGREQMSRWIELLPTLPRLLQSKGYLSFQSGKWWQNHYSRGGFTHGMTVGDETRGGRHGDKGLEIGRKTLAPIFEFWDQAQQENKPWMVWYAPMMPHDPHTPPDRLIAHYTSQTESPHVARYWGMVEWFDETCGALLGEMERRGMASNTIVVFVTDNGWITDPQTGRYAPKSKQSPYDGGLRTPILLQWPDRIRPRTDPHPVSSIDLMPTLLTAIGVPVPQGLPGIDLLNSRAVARRNSAQGACFTHDAVDLNRPALGLRWRWKVDGDWKLILPNPALEPEGKPELYQLSTDPLEKRNRAESNPRRVRALQNALNQWWPQD